MRLQRYKIYSVNLCGGIVDFEDGIRKINNGYYIEKLHSSSSFKPEIPIRQPHRLWHSASCPIALAVLLAPAFYGQGVYAVEGIEEKMRTWDERLHLW